MSPTDRPSTFISGRSEQFTYFDAQMGHPDRTGKRVLDFGGNAGNLLRGRHNRIEPANYWSIDRRAHPEAHFILYDR